MVWILTQFRLSIKISQSCPMLQGTVTHLLVSLNSDSCEGCSKSLLSLLTRTIAGRLCRSSRSDSNFLSLDRVQTGETVNTPLDPLFFSDCEEPVHHLAEGV